MCAARSIQYWELNDQLYHAEFQDMETVEGLLYFSSDGRLQLHEDCHNRPQDRLLLSKPEIGRARPRGRPSAPGGNGQPLRPTNPLFRLDTCACRKPFSSWGRQTDPHPHRVQQ